MQPDRSGTNDDNNFAPILSVDKIRRNPYNTFKDMKNTRLSKVMIETAKRAVKENDREMKVALMNRYPDNKQLWKILFNK